AVRAGLLELPARIRPDADRTPHYRECRGDGREVYWTMVLVGGKLVRRTAMGRWARSPGRASASDIGQVRQRGGAPSQEGVQLRAHRRPLADGRSHPLDGAATDVADGEDSLDPGLEGQRRPVGGARVGAGPDEAFLVERDAAAGEASRRRVGAG